MNTTLHFCEDPNVRDCGGHTPLFYNACLELIEAKADVNAQNYGGSTPLHLAEDLQTIIFLLDNKADVNIKDNAGNTPLFVKRRFEDVRISKLFIDSKADVNFQDSNGNTVLNLTRNKDAAELFIKSKADINVQNKDGIAPLHKGVNFYKLLIENKADVNIRSNYGITPLESYMEDLKSLKYLIENNADVNSKDSNGRTALHKRIGDVSHFLIISKADVNAQDNRGNTPLHMCIYNSGPDIEKIRDLVNAKADLTIKNHIGVSFIDLHNKFGFMDVSKFLTERKIVSKICKHFAEEITTEFFKNNIKYTLECILNYDNKVQKITKMMLN